jgi:hypothetical protein
MYMALLEFIHQINQSFHTAARRSSFQTTRVSVSRKWESVSLSPGRSALAPLTLSVKICLQLALLSAASCSSRFWSSVDTRALSICS